VKYFALPKSKREITKLAITEQIKYAPKANGPRSLAIIMKEKNWKI
jgi:hypothetical protein